MKYVIFFDKTVTYEGCILVEEYSYDGNCTKCEFFKDMTGTKCNDAKSRAISCFGNKQYFWMKESHEL